MNRPNWLKELLARLGHVNLKLLAACTSVSFVLWFFQSMGKEYTADIVLQLEFTNLPADQTFASAPPNQIKIMVTGIGWDLFSYHFHLKKPVYRVDLSNLPKDHTLNLAPVKDLIVQSIPGLTNILSQQPEEIALDLEPAIKKRVPVLPRLDLKPAKGYGINAITSTPPDVEIFGPKSRLDAIEYVSTQLIKLDEAQGEIIVNAKLELPEGVERADVDMVSLTADMELLTEKEIVTAIKIKGYRGSRRVVVYPRTVTIKAQATMSQFDEIMEKDFEAYVDFGTGTPGENELLELVVVNKNKAVNGFRYHPKYVDFFFEE
ncbi:MAG: YbbR-like domain-containing protein [Bacteroidetes bacterium]|nr:YbbR-like domain-containing protein [Bacteroidota bacterium]